MIARIALTAVVIGLCAPPMALARDSGHFVCSAVADYGPGGANSKIGVSIDSFDSRAGADGSSRKYVLSSIYQGKLFQGSFVDKSGNAEGSISLRNGSRRLYDGKFKFDLQGDNSTLTIDGRINDDPSSGNKLYPIKAKLPCVDLSI